MDKAEYRVMLDQITALADAGDYTGALPIVEEIDWRRVKSVRTLCMVSEIYEANDRLEDCLRILKIAYKRASISKTVLYRLAEISAKVGNYKEAINYYREFEEISPMDNSKYILKYEIYRAKGASLEDQIRVLEEYKEREYTEQWAYELAELYSKAGMKDACVDTCDDLILWFSEGSYVWKAMELKKKYRPLTASQTKKYQEQMSSYKTKTVPVEVTNEPEVPAYDFTEKILASTEAIISDNKASGEVAAMPEEVTEAPKAQPIQPIDTARMQSQLADSIRAVFSGINKEPDVFKTEMEEDADVKIYKAVDADMSGYEIKELEPETVDGISKTEAAPVVKADDGQIAGQMSLTDLERPEEFDLEALIAETTSSLAQEVASGAFQMTDETIKEQEEAAEEEAARKAAEEEAARKAAEEETERKAAEEEAARKAAEEEAARKAAEEEAARKAAEEEAARKTAEEEAIRKAAEEEATKKAAEEEAVRRALEKVARAAEEESKIYEKETDESLGLTREFNFHEELKKSAALEEAEAVPEIPNVLDAMEVPAEDDAVDAVQTEDAAADFKKLDMDELNGLLQEDAESEDVPAEDSPISEIDLELDMEFVEEEPRLKYVPVEPRELTEKEREIFSYFTKIPGMSQQITETICDVHNNAGDKTSKAGNFLIIGRQGSGKTKLYESMVLAICHDLGIEAVKMAKIIGRDLNKKDPVAIVSKLSGGFLVIEGAGELDDETVEKLSRAMEFRTDSLVVVLEDEKADLFAMLDRHPELSEKFTSSIKIPVFTNDELVTFAKTYASENGYRMDEMGVLALYTRIGDNQKDSEPVTVGKVKDIMDEAIEHANRGTRKFGRRFSKNAVDEDNRVLLLEKDFD